MSEERERFQRALAFLHEFQLYKDRDAIVAYVKSLEAERDELRRRNAELSKTDSAFEREFEEYISSSVREAEEHRDLMRRLAGDDSE